MNSEKELVRFTRSTTVKDDICYEGKKFNRIPNKENCKDCRVHIVTDRFLSKDFQRKIMNDKRDYPFGTYPYVLIVDASSCNLRCRPCYSWIFWEPGNRADPVTVSSKKLADQFSCKINKLNDESLLKRKDRIGKQRHKRPFSRIRVSGGEPLFDKEDPLNSMKYWHEFFGFLDKNLDEVVDEKITLMHEKEWLNLSNQERRKRFPIFLESDSGKIRIRFDTNGFLFSDPSFTDEFVKGIYDLNLKNLTIDLTFSLKGTNTHEVNLMIDPTSKFDLSKVGVKESIEKHPQWLPLKNLKEAIRKYEEDYFERESECIISEDYLNPWGDLSLTVERGIMHYPREKLYLYSKQKALPWSRFEKQLSKKGLNLSKTENRIYFGQSPGAKAWSYMKKERGNCEIVFITQSDEHPLYSYSTREKSMTSSKNHRKVRWENDNFRELEDRIETVQSGDLFDEKCWIELRPLSGN